MLNSDPSFWLGLVLALGVHGAIRADELKMTGDARLTGTVRSINSEGVIELQSVLSPEPILLKVGAVGKVEFTPPAKDAPPVPTTLIELANGDLLPVAVEGLDATNLNVTTPDLGKLSIPRTALKSMQLGVHSRKVIYSGPKNLEEWARDSSGVGPWSFSASKALVANGPAYAARDFDAPGQFILKFTLKWQGSPSYQIYFADPLKARTETVDRYLMQFNATGLEIKRESSTGTRFSSVILLPRTPEQFPNNQLDVEIRVDRKGSRLHLFLNGEPDGAGIDRVMNAPTGNGVQLINSSPPGGNQEIRNIEVLEFDNTGARHRSEDRGDPKTDSLISSEDDRWGGQLTSIQDSADGLVFLFKSDFQDDPLEMTEADVSTIFFARPEVEPVPPEAKGVSLLRLRGEGTLRLESCVFSETAVTGKHPLLGDVRISRQGVASIERGGTTEARKGNPKRESKEAKPK